MASARARSCIAWPARLVPSAGDILVCGHSVRTQTVDAKRKLGFGCAPEQLPGLLTGRQCLEVYANAKGLERIDPDVLELGEALKFSAYLDRFVDTYSLGTRQKLCVLLALLGEPTLVVLDEAFNGLDPGQRADREATPAAAAGRKSLQRAAGDAFARHRRALRRQGSIAARRPDRAGMER